jgi:iron complex outermembrane receptor protein
MPTFTDLYYKSPTHEGNSDVQPEKSESFELGVNYHSPFIKASANGFYMKGKDLIDWVKATPSDKWHSANLTNLDKYGFETNLSFYFGTLLPSVGSTRLDLGYMYLDQSKQSGELISNYVLDYLHHKFTVGVSHPIYKGLSADWQFRWQDREGTYTKTTWKDNLPNPSWQEIETPYPAFGVLDVKLNYALRNTHIYLTVNNLFDKQYYDLGNVPQPGTWVIGGISLKL